MKLSRLSRSSEIDQVKKSGKNVRDRYCGFRYLKQPASSFVRAAFVISTKVDKRAVVRNKLRRQYREILRAMLPDIDTPLDVIIYPSKDSISLSYAEKEKSLRTLFEKDNLLTA